MAEFAAPPGSATHASPTRPLRAAPGARRGQPNGWAANFQVWPAPKAIQQRPERSKRRPVTAAAFALGRNAQRRCTHEVATENGCQPIAFP